MVAALLVAVFLVPALCRLLLHSSRWSIARGVVAAVTAGVSGIVACVMFWNPWVSAVSPLSLWATAAIGGLAVRGLTYLMSRERLRAIEGNPTSRAILGV